MGHEEEVELAVDDFTLLYEALVDVGARGRVGDLSVYLFEEALADSLVDDDEGDLGETHGGVALLDAVLVGANLLELVELELNDVLAHGVPHAVSVDEHVVWHLAFVKLTVSLEGAREVVLQYVRGDDLLSLLGLGTGLGVVLAEVGVVGGDEADDGLLALVADVDSH